MEVQKGPVSAGATVGKTAVTSGATDEIDGTGWNSTREDTHRYYGAYL